MKINYDKYYEPYHQNGKFHDSFQTSEGIKIVPFISNTTSRFDKSCGLLGITGEFFRQWKRTETRPIQNFAEDVEVPVSSFLKDIKRMPHDQIPLFIKILRDILYVNGSLNISDPSLLKYLPILPTDETLSHYYITGQKRMAKYLYSMIYKEVEAITDNKNQNLFTTILKDSLEYGSKLRSCIDSEKNETFYIHPFIKKTFQDDLKWLFEQESSVIVKNIPLFLYFYLCYSLTQTLLYLSPNKTSNPTKPDLLYFILSNEKASKNSEVITKGWTSKFGNSSLNKLYGKVQALDLLNCCLGGNIGLYPQILQALKETPFEENKETCEKILNNYQEDKRLHLNRDSEENKGGERIDTNINSYEEFINKIYKLCLNTQSKSYTTRIAKMVYNTLNIKFLQLRKGDYVLTLDNEMLIFLIALFTKGKKTKLEDMYHAFNNYGIAFNVGTRLSIEELLLKLNLLDRKSDSGEVQYVTVIL